MSNAAPHMVVGRVGFASNGEFVAHPEDASDLVAELRLEIADLKADNTRLRGQRQVLRSALQSCAALAPAASDDKHQALLETDPQNDEIAQEKP